MPLILLPEVVSSSFSFVCERRPETAQGLMFDQDFVSGILMKERLSSPTVKIASCKEG